MALVIGGNLAINGTSGSPCTWTNVDITSIGGTATAFYVTVTGSVNSDETSITVTNGTDGGGNIGWSFGGGGASVTVPAKAFSLTTSAPAVSTGASVAVPAKAFSLTLTAPTIQAGANTVVNVPAKVYALTTAAPGVSTGVAVAVPAKQFSLFATAPAVATGYRWPCRRKPMGSHCRRRPLTPG